MSNQLDTLLDTADRIVDTDLYPSRLRNVIAELATALRDTSTALTESREYGLALVQELKDRAEKQDTFTAMASSMDADFQAFVSAVEALGAMPEGYCFCSKDRIGNNSKTHEPECRDIRAMLAARTEGETE